MNKIHGFPNKTHFLLKQKSNRLGLSAKATQRIISKVIILCMWARVCLVAKCSKWQKIQVFNMYTTLKFSQPSENSLSLPFCPSSAFAFLPFLFQPLPKIRVFDFHARIHNMNSKAKNTHFRTKQNRRETSLNTIASYNTLHVVFIWNVYY